MGAEAWPRCRWLLVALLLPLMVDAQDLRPILQRKVIVHGENIRLQTALNLIAREGGFKLSYNAAVVPADSLITVHAQDEKVESVLRRLLPDGVQWKESGGHLIITGSPTRKQRFTAMGSVIDAMDGSPIARASVMEVKRKNAVVTAANGDFEIALAGEFENTPLLFSRRGYRDTIVFVPRNADIGRVRLRPLEQLERMEPICLQDRCGVEDLGMARLLIPPAQMAQAANLDHTEKRDWQISFVPSISTNGAISGSVTNRSSFNVIGGYARGLDGFELAGGFNLESDDVRGLQIAGASNLVGGHTSGVQIAGGLNHTMLSSEGLQLAGGGNVVWDTLSGVQVAGGANIVKRVMTGTQIAGGANIALQDLNGVQVAGGVSIAHGVVNKAQVSGGMNYARAVKGGQVTAGLNVSLGDVGGGQVGLAANFARSVSGGQVSLGMNFVPGEVSGGQVGLSMNYAHSVTGAQVSLGANIVPGDVDAGQVGLALNYAGNVTGGQFTLGANIVPGVVEGGQVGVLNYGRGVVGGQVGIINLSDTLSGVGIGLLTISLKGYHRLDVMSGYVMPLSLQLRTGTRGFHNIFGWSVPVTSDERWGILYGFGTEPRLGEHLRLNIDLTGEQVVEQRTWVDAVNVLGRFGMSLSHVIADRVYIGGGPLANLLVSNWRDAESREHRSGIAPSELLYEKESGEMRLSGWLGWRVAVGVRF